jgi:hypothetical protein
MNCQRFEEVVTDLARERLLDAGVRGEMLAHSRQCEHCAVRLEDEIAITLKLKSFAVSFQSVGASARIESELIRNFEAQKPNVPAFALSRQRYWLRYGTSAIAALLLIGFALALFRPRPVTNTKEDTSTSLVTTPTTVSGPITSPVNSSPVYNGSSVRPKRNALVRRNRPSATSITSTAKPPSTTEIVTDFIPVTYGGAANLADGGRMVRVELPRSAMASFGLPVNMDRANERVKADVLMGVDGLAHAIRFVR